MAGQKFLTFDGLSKVLERIQSEFRKKVDVQPGMQLSQENFTTEEKTKLSTVAENANNYTHPQAMTGEAGTYTSVTIDKNGHVTAAQNLTTLDEYGITEVEAAKVTGQLSADNIPDIDAAKVKGVLSIENIPKAAVERLVPVVNKEARLALTTEDVQIGDTVQEEDTGLMYLVIDTEQLATEAGYKVYTAGSASTVPWAGVQDKPESMKNPFALKIQVEGQDKGTYTGESAQTINITASDLNVQQVEAISDEELESMLNGTFTEEEQE